MFYPWHGFHSAPEKSDIMRTSLTRTFRPWMLFSLIAMLVFAMPACKSKSPAGEKVKMPFTGNKYESNNRWFRGTGMGVSVKQNIARSKADLDAKNQVAAQVGTSIRAVTDQYLAQTDNAEAADVADKFQSLVREVMNTELADLRKIGEQTRYNETTKEYTQYVAYEIKKNAMFRFMKKQAKTDTKVSEATRKKIEEILDEEIRKADLEDHD